LLMMEGKQNRCVALYVGARAANVGRNLAGIPHYGIEGTASATASARAVEESWLHGAGRRTRGIGLCACASPSAAKPGRRVR
ncbi:lipopolysaccharide biosynthesis protein, partial [Rhizobium leguminosarum]